MQIKQNVLRAAAAATVTVFLAAGAMAPAQATEESQSQADDRAAHGTQTAEERRADQSKRSDDAQDDTSSDDAEDGSAAEDETEGSQQESSDDQAGEDADETQAGPGKNGAGTTCNKLGYTKIDQPSGNAELEFGTLEWGGDTLSYVIDDGFTVDLCIKSGVKAPITTFVVTGAAEGSRQIAQDISHIGYLLTEEDDTEDESEEDTDTEGGSEEDTDTEGESEETVVAPEEDGSCPEDAVMNEAGECVMPTVDEVAGVELEVTDVVADAELEVTDEVAGVEAEMAPASGVLPATGAGDYAWMLLAALGLLGAGGVLLARRRPRLDS
jgi:LPXTG-motif cell wall-anchored protein